MYMGSLPREYYSPSSHHVNLPQEIVEASFVSNSLVRSYQRSFNGFAAKLTDKEAGILAGREEVVSVFPSKSFILQTTRSWDFMGFNETISRGPGSPSDVIIGVIDGGIWPESESFSDVGFSPPPKRWKGACKGGKNFTCNNKIIGARYYSNSSDSARDADGHGTHTASTAAGNPVMDVSFYGLAQGIVRGGAGDSCVAAYRACGSESCEMSDILAAFDDAIADGVDVITISIGPAIGMEFDRDPIAIGGFHATESEILTIQSAGNSQYQGSVGSVAPWILSVAASTTDRLIIDRVVLGNGKTIKGDFINAFTLNGTKYPLIDGKDAPAAGCSEADSGSCVEGCLNSTLVKGTIVLCDRDRGAPRTGVPEAKKDGAVGAILKTVAEPEVTLIVPLSAMVLTPDNFDLVMSYANSTRQPVAEILKSEAIKDSSAPVVALFSSRGPNQIAPDILKPDISAPGVNILAAYVPIAPPGKYLDDTWRVKYNIMSGTSMACPHAAAVAAYVKEYHPNWSSSAVHSAILTTALPMDATRNGEAEFAYGAGHINPVKAIDPGLVYESFKVDYIKFLCNLGYRTNTVRLISGDNSTCPGNPDKSTSPVDLNYPTLTAKVSAAQPFNITFRRTVTNVGLPNSVYKAKFETDHSKLNISVVPQTLSFKSLYEKQSFTATVTGGGLPKNASLSGSLMWSDGNHTVRSPIVVYTPNM